MLTFVNLPLDPPLKFVTLSVSVSFVFKHFVRRLFEVLGNEALSTEALTDRFHLLNVVIIALDRGDNCEITEASWAIVLIDQGIPLSYKSLDI